MAFPVALRAEPWKESAPVMDDDRSRRYLLEILEFYRRTGNERYVLSRLVNREALPLETQTLFCRKCLVLFIPVVNCSASLGECEFSVECNACGLRISVEVDLGAERDVSALKFDDLFSHPQSQGDSL